jgi:hypothetical protein
MMMTAGTVHYRIDKKLRLILTVADGHVRFADIKAHQARLLADPDFDPTFDQVIDTTPCKEFELSAEEARILSSRPIVAPESKRAFVAAHPYVYGLGRMMEIYHDNVFGLAHVEVFTKMGDALKWLGRETV